MRTSLLALILLFSAALWAKGPSTDGIECTELGIGKTIEQRTSTLTAPDGKVRIRATVSVQRPLTDKTGDKCLVVYRLFLGVGNSPFKLVKSFIRRGFGDMVGVDIVGFSPNGRKAAANFWWAAGDYTGHMPVVYDLDAGRTQMKEIHEQITGKLPACDYSQAFLRITNEGEAVIHVPKSIYVDEGCPDQGDWLFSIETGTARRLEEKHK